VVLKYGGGEKMSNISGFSLESLSAELLADLDNFDFEASCRDSFKEASESEMCMSYWLPKVMGLKGLSIPHTEVVQLPYDVWYSARESACDGVPLSDLYKSFMRDNVLKLKENFFGERVFIKTGAFSNKFDFSTCCCRWEELTENFIKILAMSEMFDCYDGQSEVVLRSVIPTTICEKIYNGMPLRSEFRVFWNFDNDCPLYVVNYWNYSYCEPFLNDEDKAAFKSAEERLERDFEGNKGRVIELCRKVLGDVALEGCWSLDVLMDDEDDFWLIDMAVAERSAYWEVSRKDFQPV
jgi:hypothetical protein